MTNLCKGCGFCCKLFLINLSKKEYESGKYKTMFQEFGIMDFNKAKSCGANFLAKKSDNSCVYLADKKCSIHIDRPKVCRKFFCDSKMKKFEGMIEIIKENQK